MAKKKKREAVAEEMDKELVAEVELSNGDTQNKKKKSKRKEKKSEKAEAINKETPTVSIAISGSIIDNAQSLELATRLAGQIARAATIFRIDEVVVIDSNSNREIKSNNMALDTSDENESGAAFLIRILKYLETPQYLRKALFPRHNSLRFVVRKPICWKRNVASTGCSASFT